MFVQAQAERQVFGNGNSLLLRGNLMEELPALDALEGQAQCVIIDPPFRTGKNFSRTRPFGQAGWSGKGKPLSYPAFNDALGDPDAYDTFLEKLITRGKFLL